jgi:DNA-binding beta-propeller fold protein YncE
MLTIDKHCILAAACCALLLNTVSVRADDALVPAKPLILSRTQGKFDFIKIDSARHRLLACHTGNGSLDVIDLASGHLITSIPTGAAQGVAIDDTKNRYFVSTSKPPALVTIDAGKLKVLGTVSLSNPADLNIYDAKSGHVFVCNDTKPEIWVVDPDVGKILTTLTLPGGGMEDLGFDSGGAHLFQNLKDSNELAELDPATGQLLAKWPTSPSDKPHGLAMIPDSNTVLVAGNGFLTLMDLSTGRVLVSAAISQKVDEIAYDPVLHRAYCASGLGMISVVAVDPGKLTPIGTIPSAPGAHSIAVDPQTHTVWIVFAKDGQPYVQSFSAK